MSQQQAYLEAKWYALGSRMGSADMNPHPDPECPEAFGAGYDDGFMTRYRLSWTDDREES